MGRLRKLKIKNMNKANRRLITESFIADENVYYLLKTKFDKEPTEEEKMEFKKWVNQVDEVIDTDEHYVSYFNDWLETKKMGYDKNDNY